MMRVLNIACGIAVLVNALHLVHAVHHFLSQASRDSFHGPELWLGMALVLLVGSFSLIGGVLLLKHRS